MEGKRKKLLVHPGYTVQKKVLRSRDRLTGGFPPGERGRKKGRGSLRGTRERGREGS